MPIGLFVLLLSTTSKCLTLYCSIISAATNADESELIVIRGEDIMS
jgi:hypothetical protein